jgi:DNA-binding IclR family transcriptional regulator
VIPGEDTVTQEPATQANTESAVQSVQRAGRILGCFTRERHELGVTDLSRELGLHKSTVSRLLTALRDAGLVTQVAGTGKYRLSVKVLEMAGVVLSSLDLSAVADPQMRLLAERIGETVSLVVLEDGVCVALHAVPSRHRIHAVRRAGQSLVPQTSAGGRVLLAFRAHGLQEEADAALPRHTLDQIRTTGYSLVQGEEASDLVELAAPVWDHRERVVAALMISAPAYRLTDDEVDGARLTLLRAAQTISEGLGYRS